MTGFLVTVATGFPVHLLPPGPPVTQAVMPLPCPVLTGADPSAPGQPQEQTPVGDSHAEVGLKPQLSPRNGATKEEEKKSFHAPAQGAD